MSYRRNLGIKVVIVFQVLMMGKTNLGCRNFHVPQVPSFEHKDVKFKISEVTQM